MATTAAGATTTGKAAKATKLAKSIAKAEAARLVHARTRFAPTRLATQADVSAVVLGALSLPRDGPGGAIVDTVKQSNEALVNAAEQAALRTAVDRRCNVECAGTCCARRQRREILKSKGSKSARQV